MIPIACPRRRTGTQLATTRTVGVQPNDWQKPLVAHTNSRNKNASPKPNSTLSAAEPNMPTASITRGDSRSESWPLTICPTP